MKFQYPWESYYSVVLNSVYISFLLYRIMLFRSSLVTFSKTVIQCHFLQKRLLKILFLELNIFLDKCSYVPFKYPHSYIWVNVGMRFYLDVRNCQVMAYWKIMRMVWIVPYCYVQKFQFPIIISLLYYHFLTPWYIVSTGDDRFIKDPRSLQLCAG